MMARYGSPWTLSKGGGKPIWELFPPSTGERIMEAYEERAAIMEYEAGLARHTAELFAYALLVDKLLVHGVITAAMIGKAGEDILRQQDRAARIRRHWAKTRAIYIIGALCRLGFGKL